MALSQIVNVSNSEAISEVALKCGDPFFKDFPRNIYSQAVFRAERGIAHDYDVLDRVWTFTNTAGTSPIQITPLNVKGIWRVVITAAGDNAVEEEYQTRTVDEVLDNADSPTSSTNYYYAVMFNANQRNIYYTQVAVDDVIVVYYTSLISGSEDYEELDADGNTNNIPVLPNKYFEEVVRRSVRYMAKLGAAQFSALKSQKYVRILQLYSRNTDEAQDNSLERSRPWIQITPFQFP